MTHKVSVTLKMATSLDARIALADGTSQWITCAESRARTHEMRTAHDAIMVGIGTVLADDPLLTARTIPLPDKQPLRIVADSAARLAIDSRLVSTLSSGPVALATTAYSDCEGLAAAGVNIWRCGTGARVDLEALLDHAASAGVETLLVEGGGTLAAGLLRNGLVNQIEWFRAPIMIGSEGLPAIGPLCLGELEDAPKFKLVATERLGEDVLDTYVQI